MFLAILLPSESNKIHLHPLKDISNIKIFAGFTGSYSDVQGA
jgi:hypothetical protein